MLLLPEVAGHVSEGCGEHAADVLFGGYAKFENLSPGEQQIVKKNWWFPQLVVR